MNLDENEYSNDSKFKNYSNQVEKSLKAFEYSSEWADLIAALGRLIKVFQQFSKFPVIPKKSLVGKRVSQCLHPALPAGVHLKALECYDVIFRNIGPERLAADLFIYSSGLFPLLSPSAMTVKPHLFNIYESHFLRLESALKPGFVGLLQGLLPGLEEGAEFFQRGNTILEKFCEAVTPQFFYTTLWQVMLQAHSVRQYGISFLINHFNRRLSTEDQIFIMGDSVNLMLTSLCSVLGDSQVLVQRQALDFLLVALPVHNSSLLTHQDQVTLCAAALATLLRRDMSLNRRVYSWLTGAQVDKQILVNLFDSKISQQVDESKNGENTMEDRYFAKYGKELLTQAVKEVIKDPSNRSGERHASFRPFRILTSLLDRPQIGPHVMQAVLLDLLVYLKEHSDFLEIVVDEDAGDDENADFEMVNMVQRLNSVDSTATLSKKTSHGNNPDDFLRTANVFFTNLGTTYLWTFLTHLFDEVLNSPSSNPLSQGALTLPQLCQLMDFILTALAPSQTLNNTDPGVHLPRFLARLSRLLLDQVGRLSWYDLNILMKIYKRIFYIILKHADMVLGIEIPSEDHSESKTPSPTGQNNKASITMAMEATIADFRQFFYQLCVSKLHFQRAQMKQCLSQLQSSSKSCPQPLQLSLPADLHASLLYDPPVASHFRRPSVSTQPTSLAPADADSELAVWLPLFGTICRLLVEMAGFPLCTGDTEAPEWKVKVDNRANEEAFTFTNLNSPCLIPDWLGALLVCSCFVDQFHIKSAAGAALIDFIHATRSVHGDSGTPIAASATFQEHCGEETGGRLLRSSWMSLVDKWTSDRSASLRPQGSAVKMSLVFRVLTPVFLHCLNARTKFFSYMSKSLWRYLADSTPENHQQTAELIYELHQIAPSQEIVEDIILGEMLNDSLSQQLDAHRRFVVFWHLIRSQVGTKIGRTFDKCMFVLLDNLDNQDEMALRTLSRSWLDHALRTGQCGRILEPILLGILKPETARISSLYLAPTHQSIQNKTEVDLNKNNDECNEEDSIYAISNEEGNVTFHVRPKGTKPIAVPQGNSRSVSLMQSINSSNRSSVPLPTASAASSSPHKEFYIDSLPYEAIDADSVNLRINPFDDETSESDSGLTPQSLKIKSGSRNSSTNKLAEARRLNRIICQQEGIQFDENRYEDETPIGEEVSEKDFDDQDIDPAVKDVLRDLVNQVVQLQSNHESSSVDDADSSVPPVYSNLNNDTEALESNASECRSTMRPASNSTVTNDVCPLHWHLLIYMQRYDAPHVYYLFTRLKSLVLACPRLFVSTLTSSGSLLGTGGSATRSLHSHMVLQLLARHKKAILGGNFYQDVTSEEFAPFRNIMFLEIVLTVCTYYLRGSYSNAIASKLSSGDLCDNKKVQCTAAEVLDLIFTQVICLLQSAAPGSKSGSELGTQTDKLKELSCYLRDLCTKCKIHRVICHTLATTVYVSQNTNQSSEPNVDSSSLSTVEADIINKHKNALIGNHTSAFHSPLSSNRVTLTSISEPVHSANNNNSGVSLRNYQAATDAVIFFNEDALDHHVRNSYQIFLLRLVETLIRLDTFIQQDATHHSSVSLAASNPPLPNQANLRHMPSVQGDLRDIEYVSKIRLSSQSMLVSAIVHQLALVKTRPLHSSWISLILNSLPFWGPALAAMIVPVIKKCCKILRFNADIYRVAPKKLNLQDSLPPDYCRSILDCLQGVLHFCLLDRQSQSTQDTASAAAEANIITSIFSRNKESSQRDEASRLSPIEEAREEALCLLPRIIISLAVLWQKSSHSETMDCDHSELHPAWIMAHPKTIRAAILDLLSPLSVHHSPCLLVSIAAVWHEYRSRSAPRASRPLPPYEPEQLCLVDIVSAMRSLPPDSLMRNIRTILVKPSSPSTPQQSSNTACWQVGLLHFVYSYCSRFKDRQLTSVWPVLMDLLKDAVHIPLTPTGSFLLLKVFNIFVSKIVNFSDKKEQKEVQDLCHRLLECVALIAGSTLEQPTWFRRGLQVKVAEEVEGDEEMNSEGTDPSNTSSLGHSKSEPLIKDFGKFKSPGNAMETFEHGPASTRVSAIQALYLLSETMISMLDVVYKSEDKERIAPFLSSSVLPNVFPYLRHHSLGNLSSLRASSQLLSSLSSYQYTRRSWRKEAFELFMELNFFQMDMPSLRSWNVIVDHLMTQDKNTFKEAMTRLNVSPPSGLSIFSSKEAEYELRSSCMKKIAFIIFASETDQYVKSMPELQERFTDYLRLGIVAQVHTQVLLCFRVLLLRMSQQHLTSLWHIFVPELIQIFTMLKQDLQSDKIEIDFKDALLYLSACKLLDCVILLPESQVPQFLFYKWAFVGDGDSHMKEKRINKLQPAFVPIITEISELILKHYSNLPKGGISKLPLYASDLSNPRTPLFQISYSQSSSNFVTPILAGIVTLALRHDFHPEHILSRYSAKLLQTPKSGLVIFSSNSNVQPKESSTQELLEAILENEFLEPISK